MLASKENCCSVDGSLDVSFNMKKSFKAIPKEMLSDGCKNPRVCKYFFCPMKSPETPDIDKFKKGNDLGKPGRVFGMVRAL